MTRTRKSDDASKSAGMTAITPFPKLAQPALRALAAGGYDHLEQLTQVPETTLMNLHGLGPNALGKLREAMKEIGLSFADDRKL